jgi:hypothetical protein
MFINEHEKQIFRSVSFSIEIDRQVSEYVSFLKQNSLRWDERRCRFYPLKTGDDGELYQPVMFLLL